MALHIQEANMDDTTQTKSHTERAAAGYMTTDKTSEERAITRDIGFYTRRSYYGISVKKNRKKSGHGNPVVKVSDRGLDMRVRFQCTLKDQLHAGERYAVDLSRLQTSSRWCGVVLLLGEGCSSEVVLVTRPWFKFTRSVTKCPRVAEQCNVNNHSRTQFMKKKNSR
ncbi:hypothetical protein TNCV_1900811 [Trichonephila clavipes]|nr:hypothetical protein TNCV_1900811 [Trichonephila clavipes]